MKKIIILIFFAFTTINIYGGINLKGKVIDSKTHQPISLCHVKVVVKGNTSYIITDKNGEFNFLFNKDIVNVNLTISCVGYITYKNNLSISKDTTLSIILETDLIKIAEVTALSYKARFNGLNEYYFTPKDISTNVSILGEVDIIRQLQVLPGVSQGMDGTLGLFVRGGNNGNNRIELDGVPIYGNTHLFGLTSVFQSSIVKSVSFKMGGIPVKHGDFLSSITQVETKNPLVKKAEYSIDVSPYIIGVHSLFPIKKEKIGVIIGGRYSLLNQEYRLLKNAINNDGEGDITPQVYDGFTKINWKIDSLNTIDASVFTSSDYLRYNNISEITQNWNNIIYKLSLNTIFDTKTILNTKVYYNQFRNIQKQKSYDSYQQLINGILLSSTVKEFVLDSELEKIHNDFIISSGINIQYKQFLPASEKVVVSSNKTESFSNTLNSTLISGYLSINHSINERLNYETGIRAYYYQSQDYKNLSADFRFLVDYIISDNYGVEVSYDHFSQFHHVLEGLPTGWSLDLIVPSSTNFTPERSNQFYGGLFADFNQFHFNIGTYWKSLSNLVSYKNTQNIFGVNDSSWEDELESGEGESLGLEFFASRKGIKWNLEIAYTLSKTTRKYPTINNGETYPFKFDRRHILNIKTQLLTLNKEKNKQTIFALMSVSSGHKTTLAVGEYLGETPPFWDQREGGIEITSQMNNQAYHRQLMSSKNGYSMPNYLRFDIGYSFKRIRKKHQREFTISVFNITNRKNPYLYFNDNNEWYQLSIFPIMPSFRYSITF